MNDLSLEQEITRHLDAVVAPPADLTAVVRRARRGRLRQATTSAVAAVAVVAAGVAAMHWPSGLLGHDRSVGPFGPLDLAPGLRAFADDGRVVHVGGRTVPYSVGGAWLDTDAAATPYGIVFFTDDAQPMLLDGGGRTRPLADPPPPPPADWHPSSAFDVTAPHAVWAEPDEDGVLLRVYDLEANETVATRTVPCSGAACRDVRVGGFDSGVVWVWTPDGTAAWQVGDDDWMLAGGPGLEAADARGRVLLYDSRGDAPTDLPDGWRAVAGPIDATLSFDGQHVLSWSGRLRSTTPGEPPITLARGADDKGDAAFVAFDTDGSVLIAGIGSGPLVVWDCPVSGAACDRLGVVHGDPVFIGADM